MEEWRAAFAEHGFAITHEEQLSKRMEFPSWAGRHDATMQAQLRSLLLLAAQAVTAVLAPEDEGGDLTFRLTEGLFIARRVAG